MPSIIINEIDKTTAGLVEQGDYVVFVPGGSSTSANLDKFVLLETIDDLIDNFGDCPTYEDNTTSVFYNAKDGVIYDPGYLTARFLLNKGLKVLYKSPANSEEPYDTFNGLVNALNDETFYEDLDDKGLYNVRFLTTGGYQVAPLVTYEVATVTEETYEPNKYYVVVDSKYVLDDSEEYVATKTYYTRNSVVPSAITTIISIAENRGDCVALIDHAYDLVDVDDILGVASSVTTKYGAMFTPWCQYSVSGITITLPASIAYLDAFSTAIVSNPTWYATAGRLRGTIKGKPIYEFGEKKANKLTPDEGVSVNPITTINPYGILIWGNRTLLNNEGLVASSFLNIRQLLCDLKKQLYVSAKGYMFEQNSDVLWFNFKSQIQQLLNNMKSNQGVRDYQIVKATTKEKGTLAAIIRIIPIEAVEKFNITVELLDSFVVTE